MNIQPTKITIKDLTTGYIDNGEEGVVGYNGNVNLRPPYQREFVYNDVQRDLVIDSITKDYPLNVIYWAELGKGKFDVLDGQQRILSICKFVNNDFSIDDKYFHNLEKDKQAQILNYELDVYQCSGTPSEKLGWFKRINIAGEKLTDQELLNAVYHGSWLTDAKRYFSKTGCVAYCKGKDYITGKPIRQEFLETAISWINDEDIAGYMAKQQHKPDAKELWTYFQSCINWVEKTFPTYRKEMNSINWGKLYSSHKDDTLDAVVLEKEILELMEDEDVDNKKAIYEYVLDHEKENKLHIRQFSPKQKTEAFTRQKGICPKCEKVFKSEEMEADHITPWSKGGKTITANCQMLCKKDNRIKSNI